MIHEAAASPGDNEKKLSTDYTDYADLFFYLKRIDNL
jgi:hypothetical protein